MTKQGHANIKVMKVFILATFFDDPLGQECKYRNDPLEKKKDAR